MSVSLVDAIGRWETCRDNLFLAPGKIGLYAVSVLEGAQERHHLPRLMPLSTKGKFKVLRFNGVGTRTQASYLAPKCFPEHQVRMSCNFTDEASLKIS